MSVVFLDTETTGLDPDRHEVWDVAIIEEDGTPHQWHLKPQHLTTADPNALRLTSFYERVDRWTPADNVTPSGWSIHRTASWEIALMTAGRHLVGAVPSFDAAFLARLLHDNGHTPAWHYHLVDVEALAAGKLGIAPPWDSHELSRRMGIADDYLFLLDGVEYGKHTALGDAAWARLMYQRSLGIGN